MDETPGSSNPYAPPKAPVEDAPEATGGLASRGARFGANLLDGIIAGVLIYTPVLVTGLVPIITAAAQGQPLQFTGALVVGAAISGLLAIAWIVLTIVLVKRNGQTPGKKLLGIKVVRVDGTKAGLGRIFWLRNVVNSVPAFIPVVGGIYALVDILFIFGESRRCLHDRIADTIVVNA